MGNIKVIYTPKHKLHIGTGPELPVRVEAIKQNLEYDNDIIKPLMATKEQILKIHKKSFVEAVEELNGKAENINDYANIVNNDRNYQRMIDGTVITHGSFEAAKYACGSIIEAMKDEYEVVFALIRPPGHHSHRNFTHGFCIFNNTCVGVENSTKKRVLIVDLDLHFGDGIYSIFRGRENIRYISYSFIRFDGHKLKRPSIKEIRSHVSVLDPDIIYIIMGYDSLDFGYLNLEQYLKIFKEVIKNTGSRKLILELSGGYDASKLPNYVNKTLRIIEEANY